MVTKTSRKRSTKRVKTAKRGKNNTRSKKRRRGHGRGHGGRTAKRGGMPLAARIAAQRAAAAASPVLRFRLPASIPSQSMKARAYQEYKEKTENPVELLGASDAAFSAAHKALYNDELHAKYQTPARPRGHSRDSGLFSTPKSSSMFYDTRNDTPPFGQSIYSTPVGPSSDLASPPPPDLFGEGKSMSISGSPSFRRGFAPTTANPNADVTMKTLDFDDDFDDYDFETPKSSPYRKSASSLRKTFKTKPGESRSGYDTASSPPPPRFRI